MSGRMDPARVMIRCTYSGIIRRTWSSTMVTGCEAILMSEATLGWQTHGM